MQNKSFANTRARFQRLKDAKLFTGWIRVLGPDTAMVSLRKEANVSPGDQFAFQVFGARSIAMFRAELTLCFGTEMTLRLTTPIQYIRSKEEMRLLVESMAGLLVVDGVEYDIAIVDLSASGAGVVGAVMLSKGDKVELYVESPQGQVMCDGEVVYCMESDRSPEEWRIGLTVRPQNRIDTARWNQLLASAA